MSVGPECFNALDY